MSHIYDDVFSDDAWERVVRDFYALASRHGKNTQVDLDNLAKVLGRIARFAECLEGQEELLHAEDA
jgi:hypothetical protein